MNRLKTFFSSSSIFWPYALILLLIALRNPLPLVRAELWAEDATDFFVGGLTYGVKGLITPMAGYHFFIARLIAYLASFFPVYYTPFIFSGSSWILDAWAMAYFSREGFSWIIPSRGQRIFVCAVLALGPGTAEVFLNFCNLSSALTWLFVLMLLERPHRLSISKLGTFIVLLFSAGQIFVFVPVVTALIWFTREKRYAWLLLAFVPVVFLNLITTTHVGTQAGWISYNRLALEPKLLAEQFIERLLLIPVLGLHISEVLMRSSDLIFWPVSLAYTVIFCRILFWDAKRTARIKTRDDVERLWLMLITFCCTLLILAVTLIVRTYSVRDLIRPTGVMWGHRYAFLPGCMALVIWFTILFRASPRGAAKIVVFSLIFVITGQVLAVMNYRNYDERTDLHWSEQAEEIQKTIDLKNRGRLTKPVTLSGIRAHPNLTFSMTIDPN